MLTKEEYLKALDLLWESIEQRKNIALRIAYGNLKQLIEEHFELQLTEGECDLIEFALKPLVEELGWDVLLLIDKIRNCKYSLPKNNEYVKSVDLEAIVEEIDFTELGWNSDAE